MNQRLRERRAKRKKKIFLNIFLIFIIFFSLVFILKTDYFKFKEITITETDIVDNNDLYRLIDEYLKSKIIWIIPRDNIFLIGKDKLRKKIEKKYPALNDININILEASKLSIVFKEKKPKYLWCNPIIGENSQEDIFESINKCFFVDENGTLFSKAPYFSNNVYRKFTKEKKEGILNLEENILPIEEFRKLNIFLNSILQYKIKIKKIILEDFQDVNILLSRIDKNIILSEKVEIRINMDLNYEKTLRNLGLLLENKKFMKKLLENNKPLEYIDLRFDGKIIYKFKYEESNSSSI